MGMKLHEKRPVECGGALACQLAPIGRENLALRYTFGPRHGLLRLRIGSLEPCRRSAKGGWAAGRTRGRRRDRAVSLREGLSETKIMRKRRERGRRTAVLG